MHILSGSEGILAALRRSKGGHYNRASGTPDFKTNPPQDSSWLRIVEKQENVEFYHKANASPNNVPSMSGAPTVWDPIVDIDTQRSGEFYTSWDGIVFDIMKGSGTGGVHPTRVERLHIEMTRLLVELKS